MKERQLQFGDISDGYAEFVEKFKPKKTTDDCYTPAPVFDCIKNWAIREYGIDPEKIVRPFWPGGDYERFDYPEGAVVLDNPPFSILSEICRFYQYNGIAFFLFAPSLTCILRVKGLCSIIANADIVYDNGAKVRTGFVTNLDRTYCLRTAPDLQEELEAIQKKGKNKKHLPKYVYPDHVIHAARAQYYTQHGVDYRVKFSDAFYISKLNSMGNKAIFGGGFLLSEKAAAEKAEAERVAAENAVAENMAAVNAAAERVAAENAAAIVWELSPEELAIVERLGRGEK